MKQYLFTGYVKAHMVSTELNIYSSRQFIEIPFFLLNARLCVPVSIGYTLSYVFCRYRKYIPCVRVWKADSLVQCMSLYSSCILTDIHHRFYDWFPVVSCSADSALMQAAFIIVLKTTKFVDFIESFLFIKGQTFRCSFGVYLQVGRVVRHLYSFGCYRKIYSQLLDNLQSKSSICFMRETIYSKNHWNTHKNRKVI